MIVDLWDLRKRAKKYYPESVNMQRQWVRQTALLYSAGRHRLQLGIVKKTEATTIIGA